MATKKSARQHLVVETPSKTADAWTIHVQSRLVELEAVKAASDRKWGENRLITLVDSELREKFWTQNSRVEQSIASKDKTKFDSSLAGMIRAYSVLDQWAADQGITPANDQIPRIEWEMQTGQVMVIVRSVNETLALQRERQELSNHCIWSMQELEVIFNDPLVQEIIKVKAFDPTAKVVSFKANKIGGESGFDDFPDDFEVLDGPAAEKKFDTKLAGRLRNERN
jgi:hypothetical protein